MKIVETDNFGGDYPNERFLNLPNMSKEHANKVCRAINDDFNKGGTYHRFWKAVENDYKLQPGFEP